MCLSCFYIDGFAYQENALVREHVASGHEVLVIASTETVSREGKISYLDPGTYQGQDGAPVVRLSYSGWPLRVASKIRAHAGLSAQLQSFRPDVIMFHGACGYSLLDVSKYVRANPDVIFYIDSHEDFNNSARGFISKNLLHRLFYRNVLRTTYRVARKILCVSTETMNFLNDFYGISSDMLELYPIGGKFPMEDEIDHRRRVTRLRLGLRNDTTVFIQTGKLTERKRLPDALSAFSSKTTENSVFLIIGEISASILSEARKLIASDQRIRYLGWQSSDSLYDLLCASDVYVQPGTQSATMQQSLCCGCAVILDSAPAHEFYQCGNGWYVGNKHELEKAFSEASRLGVKDMGRASRRFAEEYLDYRKLADRVLN